MGTHIYRTPFDSNDPMNGEEVMILGQSEVPRTDGTGIDILLHIRFDTGEMIAAWPEEIQEKPDA